MKKSYWGGKELIKKNVIIFNYMNLYWVSWIKKWEVEKNLVIWVWIFRNFREDFLLFKRIEIFMVLLFFFKIEKRKKNKY